MFSANILLVVGLNSDPKVLPSLKESLANALNHVINKHSSKCPLINQGLQNLIEEANLKDSSLQKMQTENANLFLLVNPTSEQFRVSLFEILQSLLKDPASEDSDTFHIIFIGQVLEPSGEWLLSDSSITQAHVVKWLDGSNNKSHEAFYEHFIRHRYNSPVKLIIHTPHVGDSSEWLFAKSKIPASSGIFGTYDAIIHRFRLHLTLLINGTLKAHGKPVSIDSKSPEKKIWTPLLTEAALHESKHNSAKSKLDSTHSLGRIFVRNERPELYVFPVGDFSTQGCSVLLNFSGFNLILGAPYVTQTHDPIFWPLISAFERLDAFVLPDWSSRSILFQRYIADLTKFNASSNLGPLVVCPGEPTSSNLGLTPKPCLHSLFWAQNASTGPILPKFQLYHKLSCGDLSIQPLTQKTGIILLWRANGILLRFLSPSEQVLPCGASPDGSLKSLYKAMLSCSNQAHLATVNPLMSHVTEAKRVSTATTVKKAAPSSDIKSKNSIARPATTKTAVNSAPEKKKSLENGKETIVRNAAMIRPKTASTVRQPTVTESKKTIPIKSTSTKPEANRPATAKPTSTKPEAKPFISSKTLSTQPDVANKSQRKPATNGLASKASKQKSPISKPNGDVKSSIEKDSESKAEIQEEKTIIEDTLETVMSPVVNAVITSDLVPDQMLVKQTFEPVIDGLSSDLLPHIPTCEELVNNELTNTVSKIMCESQPDVIERFVSYVNKSPQSSIVNTVQMVDRPDQLDTEINTKTQVDVKRIATPPSPTTSGDSLNSEKSINSVVNQSNSSHESKINPPIPYDNNSTQFPVIDLESSLSLTHNDSSVNESVDDCFKIVENEETKVLSPTNPFITFVQNELENKYSEITKIQSPDDVRANFIDNLINFNTPTDALQTVDTQSISYGGLVSKTVESLMPDLNSQHISSNGEKYANGNNIDQKETVETFDPFKEWGEPQNLPPVLAAPLENVISQNKPSSKVKQESTVSKEVIQTLPIGGNIFLDVMFVPGYFTRVPQQLLVEFFGKVRARLYILSGEALDPFTGDSLILAAQKYWNIKDTEAFSALGGSFSTPQIIATDEPNDWVRWLRTPCSLNQDSESLSGEARLQAAGFIVAPAANLQDIEMTVFGQENTSIKCLGTKISF